jgi:transcriptional regulator with XRE-family HTH domain
MHLRIAELRKQQEMTLSDLAKKIEVSIPTIWRIENKATYPITPDCLVRIAHALGVSVQELWAVDDTAAPVETGGPL